MKFWTNTTVGTVDAEKRTIKFVGSTNQIDSYEEVVEQDWILDRWAQNPVILFGHNRGASGESALPIGRGLSAEIKDDRLEIDVEFAPEDLNPFAEKVFQNAAAGFIRGASVGFIPHDVRLEKRNDREVYVLRKNELLEVSICPVGANPGAVSLTGDEDPEERRAFLRSIAAKTEKTMEDEDNIETDATPVMLEGASPSALAPLGAILVPETPAPEQLSLLQVSQGEPVTIELSADVVELRQELTAARSELDAERKRNADLEDQLARLDVEKLVGVKLTPAEVDVAVADRKREGRQAFEVRMAKRPDLQLTTQVVRDGNRPSLSNADAGRRFADRINNKAQGQTPSRSAS